MKKGFVILYLLNICCISAQINTVQSVYFDFNKFTLDKNQTDQINNQLDSFPTYRFNGVYLYGYCDDRGTKEYNEVLSKNRVDYIQKLLISRGIAENKIFICEGRGKINLNKSDLINVDKVRDKNRRVDLIFVKNVIYTSFPDHPKVKDNIVLELVLFDLGSSELNLKSRNELDRISLILKKQKNIRFEIRGHVCCTSKKFSDAIDHESQNRNLSENRAKSVFLYFRSRGISPYRMSYKGYGNQFPLGKEDAKDRRVELYITQL